MTKSKNYSKSKGSRYEYQVRDELGELGYSNCKTTRSESKALDSMKVDIISDCEYNIQCKITQATPRIVDIFKSYDSFQLDKPLAIFWKTQTMNETKTRCSTQGEFVIIKKSDFYNLISKKK